jgi:hypothetical protein
MTSSSNPSRATETQAANLLGAVEAIAWVMMMTMKFEQEDIASNSVNLIHFAGFDLNTFRQVPKEASKHLSSRSSKGVRVVQTTWIKMIVYVNPNPLVILKL